VLWIGDIFGNQNVVEVDPAFPGLDVPRLRRNPLHADQSCVPLFDFVG